MENANVILLTPAGTEVHRFTCKAKRIGEATMLTYQGRYYAYKGLYGHIGVSVVFQECAAPLAVEDLDFDQPER